MDVAQVIAILEATLSGDNAIRSRAEAVLLELQVSPGWPSGLLQVIGAPDSGPNVRLASALALKRAAMSLWHNDDPNTPSPYPPETKEFGAWQLAFFL